MRIERKRGSTSVMVRIFIPDNSVTTGAGCTGLTYGSTNLTIAYLRELDSAWTVITGANILDITTPGTWLDPTAGKVRFKAVGTRGYYELQFADGAAFGTGDLSQNIIVDVYETTTTALKIGPCAVMIPLVPYDPQDGVRLGLTALPNAAAGASGGLPLSVDTSGRVDVLKVNGTSQTARDLGASVLLSPGTGVGQLDITTGVVKANWVQYLGTALTGTAANIVAAIAKFFDKTSPTGTINSLPDAVAGAANGVAIVGSSMLITPGTSAGQLDVTAGVVKANLVQILAAAITGTAAQIVAAFTKWFNVATPTGTVNSIPDAVPGAANGVAIVGSAMALTSAYDAAKTAADNADILLIKAVTDVLLGAGFTNQNLKAIYDLIGLDEAALEAALAAKKCNIFIQLP